MLKDHIKDKLTQKASKLKTEKGRANYMTKIDELAQLVDNNSELLTTIVKTLNEAAKIKMLLWEGFKQTKTGYDTYYKSRTKGYFKGDMEGIRMSDQDGNIVKIVDRTNFSSYNRDPDIVGGWERESLEESMDNINEEYDDSGLEEVAKQYNIPVEKLEKFIVEGGVYGNQANRVAVQTAKKNDNKFKYLLSRIFERYDMLKFRYPILQKHRWLMPVMQVRRWFGLLNGNKAKRAISEVQTLGVANTDGVNEFLTEIGL